MSTSKRITALAELAARLAYITKANGYSSDAGQTILFGELPTLGPDDADAALAIFVDDGTADEASWSPIVQVTVPVEVRAYVGADITAPLLALEALIVDIRTAVEKPNLTPGHSRMLEGTMPTGLNFGTTKAYPRQEGSDIVGAGVQYLLAFEERWGEP